MHDELDELLIGMTGHAAPAQPRTAQRLARDFYGLEAAAERLTGERDENFRLTCADGSAYVLKIANAAEDRSVLDLLTAVLLHVDKADPGFPSPRVCRDLEGRTQVDVADDAGTVRTVRMLTWLPGKPLRFASRSPGQRAACGRLAARLALALRDFDHPASHRPLIWNLRNLPKMRLLLDELPDFPQADLVARLIALFEADIAPRLAAVRQQVAHNDLNDRNILVDPADETLITGIIDYGDTVHTALVADVAIMIAEQIIDTATLESTVAGLLDAYQQVTPLLDSELAILRPLIAARIVMSCVIPLWHKSRNPSGTHYARVNNEFVAGRLELARRLL